MKVAMIDIAQSHLVKKVEHRLQPLGDERNCHFSASFRDKLAEAWPFYELRNQNDAVYAGRYVLPLADRFKFHHGRASESIGLLHFCAPNLLLIRSVKQVDPRDDFASDIFPQVVRMSTEQVTVIAAVD